VPGFAFMTFRPHLPVVGSPAPRLKRAGAAVPPAATTPPDSVEPVEAAEPAIPTQATPDLMARLQAQLQDEVDHAPARSAAVYVQDIGSGLTAAANPDRQFLAASLIKLPVMGATYERWEDHPKEKTRLSKTWMEWMITVSDNGSTDRLIDLVKGPEVVTRFCSERGWETLKVRHAINNHRGRRGINVCTAEEMGELLATLDRRKLVSPEADEEMWQVLCRSKKLLRIPAGVPDAPGIQVGNKTGTLSNALHDSAIVRTPRTHYALCILLSGQRGEASGNRFCRDVSRLVFDALHGPLEPPQSVAQGG
jgi:beta-lactamase class A